MVLFPSDYVRATLKERRYFCSHPFWSDEKTPRPGDAFMQSAALTDDGYISSRIFVSWQPSVRARRLRQNFCERSGPQDLQGQVEGLEIRLSERSEFPYFPCSRLRRSCASSCFDADGGEGRGGTKIIFLKQTHLLFDRHYLSLPSRPLSS